MSKHQPLKGVALILGAMAILPFLDVCAKFLGQQGVPVMQTVWARMAISALLTLPFALREVPLPGLWPERPALHAVRGSLIAASTFFFFAALKFLPIADTLAIFFIQPVLIVVLSALILREAVGPRRWLAVAAGFIGVLVIIRPGLKEFNPGVVLALCSGLCFASYIIMTRKISGQASALMTTFHSSLMSALVLTVLLPFFWQPVSPQHMILMGLVGLIAVIGHYMITRAYGFAEASLLAPLAYTEMITAVAAGWYFFGDFPDHWTFIGVAILIACAIYISWRERAHGRTAVVNAPHAID